MIHDTTVDFLSPKRFSVVFPNTERIEMCEGSGFRMARAVVHVWKAVMNHGSTLSAAWVPSVTSQPEETLNRAGGGGHASLRGRTNRAPQGVLYRHANRPS